MMNSSNTIAIPIGATIKEQIEKRGMKQKEFALRMNMSEKYINRLLCGEVELTKEIANKLELLLGIPEIFWNNLEANYREKQNQVGPENIFK